MKCKYCKRPDCFHFLTLSLIFQIYLSSMILRVIYHHKPQPTFISERESGNVIFTLDSMWPGGVRYAKSLSIQYFIDIDILQNSLFDIDIFKIVRIDIDIDIFKTISIWISIFFKLSLSISISILIFSNFPYQNPYVQTFLIDIM